MESGVHPIAQFTTGLPVDKGEELDALARVVLKRLDRSDGKSQLPVAPLIGEMFGLHKAGKDSQIIKIDRWFRSRKFQVWFTQESAETKQIRATFRKDPYAFEMTHFAYAFGNLLSAPTSRDFHLIVLNRGVIDTLCWLEWHHRAGTISEVQYTSARNFILNGPWMETLDFLICLVCDVETSLLREFGPAKPKKYGSRMNPESLSLMRECVLAVCDELMTRFPNLPLIKIDTTQAGADDASQQIITYLLRAAEKRLQLREDELLPYSVPLLRKRAWIMGPELKFRGVVDHEILRKQGWELQGATEEEDIYITPKGKNFLDGGECFHIRRSGGKTYFVYKANASDPRHRAKIHIPIPPDCEKDILPAFDIVDTVRKKREIFARGGFLINRDHVEGLGDFTEVKALSVDGEDVTLFVASQLGFSEKDTCSETYVRLHWKNPTRRTKNST